MSWLPKSFFALVLLTLAACGFTPMYGSGAGAPARMEHVDIALIPDQSGVYLRNILIDHFYQDGYPVSPTHILQVSKIAESKNDLDITIESEATRKQVLLTTNIALVEKVSGKTVLSRRLKAITSYNVLGSQFTTRISDADAREAALADLARQIEAQVTLYFNR